VKKPFYFSFIYFVVAEKYIPTIRWVTLEDRFRADWYWLMAMAPSILKKKKKISEK
jgi:hypothetical protein